MTSTKTDRFPPGVADQLKTYVYGSSIREPVKRFTSAGRYGFVGEEAAEDIRRRYVGKRVPDKFRKKGAAYPIKYTW